jgi:perosamine synthetase
MFRIPVYQPSLTGNEKKYVNDCLDSNWISSKGKYVNLFEAKFCDYTELKYATGVPNGTIALHLALLALGIGCNDEVIVPTLTYIASVNAIVYTGAKPVFVDSSHSDWQMDPVAVAKAVTSKTKAIMAVHLYGHACDMRALNEIAKLNELFIIEDCAEALGSSYSEKHVGNFSDIATFSFYGNKTITTGEGGMVATNNKTLFERAYHLKGQGLAKYREYWHDTIGYNYRMTNICAAIGLAQLERIDSTIQCKRDIYELYSRYLRDSGFTIQPELEGVFHTYWMVSVLVPNAESRDIVRQVLKRQGIETRPVFYPVHTMPMYASRYESHPVAEDIGARGINLPSFPGLTEEQIEEVCTLLKSALIP